jgi:hypothetical protein
MTVSYFVSEIFILAQFQPVHKPEMTMEKQIDTNIETYLDSGLFRELLDSEAVLVGGGEVIVFGN